MIEAYTCKNISPGPSAMHETMMFPSARQWAVWGVAQFNLNNSEGSMIWKKSILLVPQDWQPAMMAKRSKVLSQIQVERMPKVPGLNPVSYLSILIDSKFVCMDSL